MSNNSHNEELLQSFLNYLDFEKKSSKHTVTSYKNDLLHFLKNIGEKPIAELTSKDIRLWISKLSEEGTAPRSINRKITAVRSFFYFLQKVGKLNQNVARKVHSLKAKKRLPFFVEDEKMNILLNENMFTKDFSGLRDKVIIELLYTTGIRRAELLGLEIQSVNLAEGNVKVFGKRSKERIIPLLPESLALLKEYIAERNKVVETSTTRLIVTDKGEEAYENFVYRTVRKYLGEVTTIDKKSPHVLRHSFATHLLNNGADINDIKELLGHANLAATQVYTHNSFEKLKEVYKHSHPRN
ncbi:MAG: tyrosine-type recombinase/integrase [Bacteroidales bacterium]|nr:tyrosine-type recombinase/integrase [Bacteroidales bacterium]